MTPIEVVRFCKARSDSRRRDLIERSWYIGMFSGLAFAGKLQNLNRYQVDDPDSDMADQAL